MSCVANSIRRRHDSRSQIGTRRRAHRDVPRLGRPCRVRRHGALLPVVLSRTIVLRRGALASDGLEGLVRVHRTGSALEDASGIIVFVPWRYERYIFR